MSLINQKSRKTGVRLTMHHMAGGGWVSLPAELLKEVSDRLPADADQIHIRQIIVPSGPWDRLFWGGNVPSFFVAAAASFIGWLVAILGLPRACIAPKKRSQR